ncbi:glycosyltransferase family 32 protein [Aspergillus lucknowensis]|uniref:Glycosyl transferase n=1 Tax=Aspergillus lucknowensis TaxID=176173 RepID=A0ABR4LZD3_9EURO
MLLPRPLRRVAAIILFGILLLSWQLWRVAAEFGFEEVQDQYPLLLKYLEGKRGNGGAWHLPEEWTQESATNPRSIIDAATVALNATTSQSERQLPHSTIPRVIHQTWKDTRLETWPEIFRQSVEKWLAVVEEGDMAYMFWDDNGVAQFVKHFEPDLEDQFNALPSNVERSDVFRVLVSKWIGGVYVDADTEPLQRPTEWITQTDILPWQDPEVGRSYRSTEPVRAIVGIEADNPPDKDTYWRMGYFYPVQLTQWSFAWAPGHPILQRFLDHVFGIVRGVAKSHGNDLRCDATQQELDGIDPVNLTGPIVFTDSVRTWLEMKADLRWDSLSGLEDGGISKLVEDVLVLPITGFSPGRGISGNMGSKPITDPSARLYHHAKGSWRKFSLVVEYGKVCRKLFGLCRDWPKVSNSNWILL